MYTTFSSWGVYSYFIPALRLHNEFPELVAATKAEAGPILIAEVGCGKCLLKI